MFFFCSFVTIKRLSNNTFTSVKHAQSPLIMCVFERWL